MKTRSLWPVLMLISLIQGSVAGDSMISVKKQENNRGKLVCEKTNSRNPGPIRIMLRFETISIFDVINM